MLGLFDYVLHIKIVTVSRVGTNVSHFNEMVSSFLSHCQMETFCFLQTLNDSKRTDNLTISNFLLLKTRMTKKKLQKRF